MNPNADHFVGGGYNNGGKHGLGGIGIPDVARDDSRMLIWEASRMLQKGFMAHGTEMPYLLELAHNLSRHLENTRMQYNRAVNERAAAQRRLQDANMKLAEVEQLVKRYATVRDPVLASDGYTYERESIRKYLEECSSGNSKAYSQQTKEELTDLTVPNKSLYRLVSHLREIGPVEVPRTVHRAPISLPPGGMAPRSVWDGEDMAGGLAPVDVGRDGGRVPSQSAAIVGGGSGAGGMRLTGPAAAGQTFAGVMVPAPASASASASNSYSARGGGRFGSDKMGGRGAAGAAGAGGRTALHPCLRVYGFCNFMDDCTFASYPYDACLNHIKGKCRFGQNCKELHVDPRDPRYQNPRSYANQHSHHHSHISNNINTNAASSAAPAAVEGPAREKATEATAAATTTTVTAASDAEPTTTATDAATTPATDSKAATEKSDGARDKKAPGESDDAADAKSASTTEPAEAAERKSANE